MPEQKKWAAISRSDYHKFIPWLCGINIFEGACEGSLDIACNNVFTAEGRQHCFKCGKETRVIGFAYDCILQYEIEFIDAGEGSVSTEKNYDLNIMPADENLPDYIIDIAKKNFNFDLTFSKTTKSKYLEPIPVGVHCYSQFGHGQCGTTGAYTQYVRMIRYAHP